MDDELKEDIKRMNDALLDQKTIEQLSSTGKAAKAKRDQLKEKLEMDKHASETDKAKDKADEEGK